MLTIQLLSKCLLSTYYVLGTVLVVWDLLVNREKSFLEKHTFKGSLANHVIIILYFGINSGIQDQKKGP